MEDGIGLVISQTDMAIVWFGFTADLKACVPTGFLIAFVRAVVMSGTGGKWEGLIMVVRSSGTLTHKPVRPYDKLTSIGLYFRFAAAFHTDELHPQDQGLPRILA